VAQERHWDSFGGAVSPKAMQSHFIRGIEVIFKIKMPSVVRALRVFNRLQH